MWDGGMLGYNWMLGFHWGGWLVSVLIVVLIVVVIQRTGRPHNN